MVQTFVKDKVTQVQHNFVDRLIDPETVGIILERRMSTSAELDGTTLEVRTIEVLLEIQKCFFRNLSHLNMGGSSDSSVLNLEPPWDLLNITSWGTRYDAFIDKTVHKTYFTQLHKQISDELGVVPSSLQVHRHLPELFGAIWYESDFKKCCWFTYFSSLDSKGA